MALSWNFQNQPQLWCGTPGFLALSSGVEPCSYPRAPQVILRLHWGLLALMIHVCKQGGSLKAPRLLLGSITGTAAFDVLSDLGLNFTRQEINIEAWLIN